MVKGIVINIDYYMAFFISYPLSALGHDIIPRADWYQVLLVA
jgi:hypothetical protein